MRRGSITPFCAMMLMLIAAFLLVLLESARVYGMEQYARLKAESAVDSVCGEYQPYLWQEYGLLFLDGAYGTETFSMGYVIESLENYIELNCDTAEKVGNRQGLNLFELAGGEVLLEGYGLATDDDGTLFLNYVSERQKEQLPLAVAAELYQEYQETEKLDEAYGGTEEAVSEARKVIAEAKSEWIARWESEEATDRKENGEVKEEIWVPDTSALDSVLDGAKRMQLNSTLNQVFMDISGVSTRISKPISKLSDREKECGTMHLKGNRDWYQKLLVIDYLEDYFTDYTHQKDERMLQYEMEYVIGGKNTEWENLECTLRKLLLVREAANVAYLLQDEEKMAWAEGMAEVVGVLAGGNPAVVKVVQIGIVGAWAYMESVLDVRTLVSGGAISLMKQAKEWTTSLDNLFAVFDENAKAKECEAGMNYVDYLKQLLFMMQNRELAYRMMEVMEMGMQGQERYGNCRMDHMLVMMRFKVCFESRPVFSSLISVGEPYKGNYVFEKKVERSYIP